MTQKEINKAAYDIIAKYVDYSNMFSYDERSGQMELDSDLLTKNSIECAKIHVDGIIEALNEAGTEFDIKYVEPTLSFYEHVKIAIENYNK